jgi:hypothetical protein
MPQPPANPDSDLQASTAELLVGVINEANHIFAGRHNWLSPLTSEQERQQFISRCCDWWNHFVCPAMDRVGAEWNETRQRFEMPEANDLSR